MFSPVLLVCSVLRTLGTTLHDILTSQQYLYVTEEFNPGARIVFELLNSLCDFILPSFIIYDWPNEKIIIKKADYLQL